MAKKTHVHTARKEADSSCRSHHSLRLQPQAQLLGLLGPRSRGVDHARHQVAVIVEGRSCCRCNGWRALCPYYRRCRPRLCRRAANHQLWRRRPDLPEHIIQERTRERLPRVARAGRGADGRADDAGEAVGGEAFGSGHGLVEHGLVDVGVQVPRPHQLRCGRAWGRPYFDDIN